MLKCRRTVTGGSAGHLASDGSGVVLMLYRVPNRTPSTAISVCKETKDATGRLCHKMKVNAHLLHYVSVGCSTV